MIKSLCGGTMPTLLDIKTKDGKQIFYGQVKIHDGSFVDMDNAKVQITRDNANMRYICKIEV